jgi:peptidoglycan hydrolase CwlO-like protein
MNVECDKPALDELENAFRFNDAVLRSLVLRRDRAINEPSPMMKEVEEEREREAAAQARQEESKAAAESDAPAEGEPAAESSGEQIGSVEVANEPEPADSSPDPAKAADDLVADTASEGKPEQEGDKDG